MGVEAWVWAVSLVGLVGLLSFDLLIIGRRPRQPTLREATLWVVLYIALAIGFGAGILAFSGPEYASQFVAGWLTEYSLSVDNLFVFLVIMSRFAVPRRLQQRTLMIGIVLALVIRGVLIAAGAALVSRFDWVFFVLGAFLLFTAYRLTRSGPEDESDFKENPLLRLARRWLRTAADYDETGHILVRTPQGRRLSPVIIVIVALGTTDVLFALDSIPAVFGLTTEAYLIFAANVFALMGLRQLYFLLGNLLERLRYLSYGMAVVLAFIGVKLVLQALHGNNLRFINGGQPVSWAPEVPTWLSLAVVAATLLVTTVASAIAAAVTRRHPVPSPREGVETAETDTPSPL